MEKNRKKQIVVLSIALVCIFILVFSLFHFFQNLHIGKFFYMGNSIMVRFYSMDC